MRALAILAALLATGCLADGDDTQLTSGGPDPQEIAEMRNIRSEPLPPPAPAGAAERAEADAALAQGSNAALILFLARNPDDRNAPRIRQALAARRSPDAPGTARALAGGEGDILAEFDEVRLNGTAAAWQAFIARHPDHPLAAEAARWR